MHHIHYFVQSQRREGIREAPSPNLQIALTLRLHITQSGHARFDLLSQRTAWKEVLLPPNGVGVGGGGGGSPI